MVGASLRRGSRTWGGASRRLLLVHFVLYCYGNFVFAGLLCVIYGTIGVQDVDVSCLLAIGAGLVFDYASSMGDGLCQLLEYVTMGVDRLVVQDTYCFLKIGIAYHRNCTVLMGFLRIEYHRLFAIVFCGVSFLYIFAFVGHSIGLVFLTFTPRGGTQGLVGKLRVCPDKVGTSNVMWRRVNYVNEGLFGVLTIYVPCDVTSIFLLFGLVNMYRLARFSHGLGVEQVGSRNFGNLKLCIGQVYANSACYDIRGYRHGIVVFNVPFGQYHRGGQVCVKWYFVTVELGCGLFVRIFATCNGDIGNYCCVVQGVIIISIKGLCDLWHFNVYRVGYFGTGELVGSTQGGVGFVATYGLGVHTTIIEQFIARWGQGYTVVNFGGVDNSFQYYGATLLIDFYDCFAGHHRVRGVTYGVVGNVVISGIGIVPFCQPGAFLVTIFIFFGFIVGCGTTIFIFSDGLLRFFLYGYWGFGLQCN